MSSAPKDVSRADRLLATAQEPNLSSWGWPAAGAPERRVKVIRTTSLVGALCLAVMLVVVIFK